MNHAPLSRRSLFAGAALAGASACGLQAARAATTFVDVASTSLFAKEIQWMYTSGISTGWVVNGQRYYRPLNNVNRDAMAAFLYRFAGSPSYTPPRTSPFIDVTPTQMFYKEMCWLKSKGISTGWTTRRGAEFRPLASIHRDAMAAFLFRLYGAKGSTYVAPPVSPFADITPRTQFYKEMCWMFDMGISTGWVTGGRREYRPIEPIHRDAMAAFLYRFNSVVKNGGPTGNPTPAQITAYILPMINQARRSAGLQPLKEHSGLASVAQKWSQTMASDQNLRHNPNFSNQIPSGWRVAGENVGYATINPLTPYETAKTLFDAWMASQHHRENILEPRYTHVGHGWAWSTKAGYYPFAWGTQNFAQY